MEAFFDAITQFTPLSNASKDALARILRRISVPKGEVLVKRDSVCNYIYFIESGLTRTFYYKDGKDITDWITAERDFALFHSKFYHPPAG